MVGQAIGPACSYSPLAKMFCLWKTEEPLLRRDCPGGDDQMAGGCSVAKVGGVAMCLAGGGVVITNLVTRAGYTSVRRHRAIRVDLQPQ